jgi:hypothetical protein
MLSTRYKQSTATSRLRDKMKKKKKHSLAHVHTPMCAYVT